MIMHYSVVHVHTGRGSVIPWYSGQLFWKTPLRIIILDIFQISVFTLPNDRIDCLHPVTNLVTTASNWRERITEFANDETESLMTGRKDGCFIEILIVKRQSPNRATILRFRNFRVLFAMNISMRIEECSSSYTVKRRFKEPLVFFILIFVWWIKVSLNLCFT